MKKLTIVVGTILAILFVFGINCYAQGNVIYGCYHKHEGWLRIVRNANACRHFEIPISWNKSGPQGPMGPRGPQGIPGEQGPRVYDAKKQFLGTLPSPWDGSLSILIPSLSKFILLSPESGDVDPDYPTVYLYFDKNDDCTGNSYLDASMRYQVIKLGSKYIIADDVPSDCINITSVWTPNPGRVRQCQPGSPICTHVLPYKEVQLPFSTPVAFPLHFE